MQALGGDLEKPMSTHVPALMLCNNCGSPVRIHGKQGAYIHISCPGCGLDNSSQLVRAVAQAEEKTRYNPPEKSRPRFRRPQPEVIVQRRRAARTPLER